MSNTNTTASVKRGRPTVEGSKRQAVLAMRDEKRANGLEIKRGRPKKAVTIEVDVVAKTRTVKSSSPKPPKGIQVKEITPDIAIVSFN